MMMVLMRWSLFLIAAVVFIAVVLLRSTRFSPGFLLLALGFFLGLLLGPLLGLLLAQELVHLGLDLAHFHRVLEHALLRLLLALADQHHRVLVQSRERIARWQRGLAHGGGGAVLGIALHGAAHGLGGALRELLAQQILLGRLLALAHRTFVHPVHALQRRRLVAIGCLQLPQLLQLPLFFDVLAQLGHFLLLGGMLLLGNPDLLHILHSATDSGRRQFTGQPTYRGGQTPHGEPHIRADWTCASSS